MLLAQKPPASINFHRRHPASISGIVVSHPTGTPGVFALAKPLRTPPRGHQRSQSPRYSPRQQRTPQRFAQQPVERPSGPRGRQSKPEQQPPSSTPNDSREETPAEPHASPAPQTRGAPSRRSRNKSSPNAAAATSDPALDRPSSPVKPLLASAPISVPDRRASTPPRRPQVARSDPLTINTGLGPKPARKERRRKNKGNKRPSAEAAAANGEWDFPVVQESDDEDSGPSSSSDEPTTPVRQTGRNDRAWLDAFGDGPKTAPLTGTQSQFPFFTFPSRATQSVPRTKTPVLATPAPVTPPRPPHRRAPSQPASLSRATSGPALDGSIFQFSEDEGGRSTPPADVQKKLAALFGSSPTSLFGSPSPSPPQRKSPKQRESVDVGRALFASSSFQLAPEPVDLPKPSFLPRPNQA